MKNVFAGADNPRRRRGTVGENDGGADLGSTGAEAAGTEALPVTADTGSWGGPHPATETLPAGTATETLHTEALHAGTATEALPAALPAAAPELPDAADEPFVPRSRYVMGRSTKILVCVALVAGGMFAGSAVQKQIDAGNRSQRANFGTFQNGGNAGSQNGGGTGSTTPGQGRRGGQAGTGGTTGTAGGSGTGTGGQASAPAQSGGSK